MGMYLARPRQQQRNYGSPQYTPTPGMAMTPPAPSYPRMIAASTAAAMPFAPTPAPHVTTNPSLTPFQLSVNNQRAAAARSAATFAKAAPLPMAPVPATATPAMMPYAPPTAPAPTGAQPATMPMGPQAPATAETPAPQMQYSGSFRNEQEAQAAKDAYVQRKNDEANAIDRGPGLGTNSYANADLQRDANARANEAATTPNAKDEYYQGRAELAKSQAETLVPAQAKAAEAKGAATTALAQPKADDLAAGTKLKGAKADAAKTGSDAATLNAQTGAAKENRLAKAGNSKEFVAADKNAAAMITTALRTRDSLIRRHSNLVTQANSLTSTDAQRAKAQAQADQAYEELKKADTAVQTAQQEGMKLRKGAAGKTEQPAPAAGQAAPATQPAANAIQPQHINPQTGQKYGLDPATNQWVEV